jgi:uncharacterized protein YfaS (alpha-2-macroglobulin family)
LPDNLTTWLIETIVNTPNNNKVWVAYNTITTSQKVVINDNLPNFFWVWDKITLSPVVFNKTWKDWEFKITLNATNTIMINDSINLELTYEKYFTKSMSKENIGFGVRFIF